MAGADDATSTPRLSWFHHLMEIANRRPEPAAPVEIDADQDISRPTTTVYNVGEFIMTEGGE
jgi:hypothetical protein